MGVILSGLAFKVIKWPAERPYLIIGFLFFMSTFVISYGIMLLNNKIHVWPSLTLDYSTHTPVSLTLVMLVCALAG
jgi:hypothetical protein